MSRFGASQESLAALTSGAPVTTTFNGWMCALVPGASQGFILRRLVLGVRKDTTTPTSMQCVVGIYRATGRTVGTGFSTIAPVAFQTWTASQVTGLDYSTATTAGTTGPTIGGLIKRITFNTQAAYDMPYEMLEEIVSAAGTANGIALVNLDNALPATHQYTFDFEWEE